jgi:hypothetical protein
MKTRLEERIYTYSNYLKQKFGRKIFRVGLSTGIPCPHRHNSGGCVFCDPHTFTGDYVRKKLTIQQQLQQAIPKIKKSCGDVGLMAYFQDETSTAGNLTELRQKFSAALVHPEVYGLVLSTRPDFLDVETVKMLKQLSKPVTIEIGLQSIHNSSLEFLNRGHTFQQAHAAIELSGKYGLEVGVHLIMGIPGENFSNMLETVKYVSQNDNIKQVKFHNLVVYKGTKLAHMLKTKDIISIDNYIDILANLLAYLKGNKVVARLFTSNIAGSQIAIGDLHGNKTKWMNWLRKKMIARKIIQGCKTDLTYNGR